MIMSESLEDLKAIVDNVPEGATHIAKSIGQRRYLKHNVRRDFVYHDGRTFCAFPSKSRYLNTCKSIRSLSDIKRIIELTELLEDIQGLGFLEESSDSGLSHRAVCRRAKQLQGF